MDQTTPIKADEAVPNIDLEQYEAIPGLPATYAVVSFGKQYSKQKNFNSLLAYCQENQEKLFKSFIEVDEGPEQNPLIITDNPKIGYEINSRAVLGTQLLVLKDKVLGLVKEHTLIELNPSSASQKECLLSLTNENKDNNLGSADKNSTGLGNKKNFQEIYEYIDQTQK